MNLARLSDRYSVATQIEPSDIKYFAENVAEHALDYFENIFLRNKTHLYIDLCMFELSVSPGVFVTIAVSKLKIFIESRYHEDLLE